jgi:hypothetical protein
MLCDRDALPVSDPTKLESISGQRVKLLKRYHLENYFLDEPTIVKLFESITPDDHWLRSAPEIRSRLRSIASKHASYAAALIVSGNLRENIGNVDLMPKECHGKSAVDLAKLVAQKASEEKIRVNVALDMTSVEAQVIETMQRIQDSLNKDDEDWKALIPGKPIITAFCATTPLKYDGFRTAYIRTADTMALNPFAEIIGIFAQFDSMEAA